ncbi:amidase family protein [Spirillospora sp. NPDC048819]|uniref:amidase n=1 Tax=Spirillospora sp. NPDC048819 TaxID=3155268 RepID=UPI003400C830
MQLHEYARYDAVGLRNLIKAGEVTADEVEAVAREALTTANAVVNGLALPLFTPALDHAGNGPFTGVPFLIKDHGPVARGIPFSLGSRALQGVAARHDSDLMARFRAAGLVTLGLTTVPEMAISFSTESVRYGPTLNPWDLERGVGGSSGGAAALVAAGAVPVAHGSDGAGSIRIPAACCGLVGLKPSRGRVPCGPDMGEPMLGMAYEFALTRTVRDAAHLLDAVQGPGVGDKYTAPPPRRGYADETGTEPGPLRVAVNTAAWSGAWVDPQIAEATVRVGRTLEQLGHAVTEARPVIDWDAVMQCTTATAVAIASTLLLSPARPDPAKLEAVSRRLLEVAKEYSALDLMAAFGAQNRVTRSVGAFFTDHDLLVTPTLGRLPAPHGTLRYDDPGHTLASWLESIFDYGPFTMVFNISGQPAISLPLGQSDGGLPIGVQIIAPYGREDLLFQTAAQLEHTMPWNHRTPRSSIRSPE